MRRNSLLACLGLAVVFTGVPGVLAQDARDPVDIAQCPAVEPTPPPAASTTARQETGKNAAAHSAAPATQRSTDATVTAPATSQPAAAIAPVEIPHRQPPITAYESAEQQQRAQAAQDRALSQDNGAFEGAGIDTSSWGEEPVYEPHTISIDIPDESFPAPAEASAPAEQSRTTVGATPPRVGSKPKGSTGAASR